MYERPSYKIQEAIIQGVKERNNPCANRCVFEEHIYLLEKIFFLSLLLLIHYPSHFSISREIRRYKTLLSLENGIALPFRQRRESGCRNGRCRIGRCARVPSIAGGRCAIYRHLRCDKTTEFVTPRNFIPAGINFDLSSANDLIGSAS